MPLFIDTPWALMPFRLRCFCFALIRYDADFRRPCQQRRRLCLYGHDDDFRCALHATLAAMPRRCFFSIFYAIDAAYAVYALPPFCYAYMIPIHLPPFATLMPLPIMSLLPFTLCRYMPSYADIILRSDAIALIRVTLRAMPLAVFRLLLFRVAAILCCCCYAG